MRKWVHWVALAVIAAGCGGGGTDETAATADSAAVDDTTSVDDTTVTEATPATGSSIIGAEGGLVFTSDAIAALEVPTGALDIDTEITMTAIPVADFPEGLDAFDGVFGYDLQPDGLTFGESATVTFVLASGGEGPISLLFTQNAPGGPLIPISMTDVAVSGGTVTITGTVQHFSRIWNITIGQMELDPGSMTLAPGGPPGQFDIVVGPAKMEEFLAAEVIDKDPFIATETVRDVGDDGLLLSAELVCTQTTDGEVFAAYGYVFEFKSRIDAAEVEDDDDYGLAFLFTSGASGLDIFSMTNAPFGVTFRATGDADCPGSAGTTSTGTATDESDANPAPADGQIGAVVDDLGEGEPDSTGAQPASRDIATLSHTVFNGNHSISVVHADELQPGDKGQTTVRVTFPGQDPIQWAVAWEMKELGSSSSTSGPPGPTPIAGVGADGFFANFSEFTDGLPSGTRIEITSCDENGGSCDSIEYTVP